MRIFLIIVVLLLSGIFIFYQFHKKEDLSLAHVKSWGYQLQGREGRALDISGLKNLPFDLIVTDYSATGEKSHEFRQDDINIIKKTGKIVLAYMSIGEASHFRYYFKALPKFVIEKENPKWPGAYKVRYWLKEWKSVILGSSKSMLERIVKAGFDGVYLDIVDAYQYFGFKENGGNGTRETSAMDMIEFVEEISRYAKKLRQKKFFVFVQNASGIVAPYAFPKTVRENKKVLNQWQERYFSAIDAIGVEDIFFRGEKENNNPYNPNTYALNYLKEFQKKRIPIFSIEYIQEKNLVDHYFKVSKEAGFIPLAAERSLDGRFLKSLFFFQ